VETAQGKAYFSSRLRHDPSRDELWPVLCRYLQKDIPADSRVLELGGGYCNFINNIKASEKHVVDIYEGVKELAAENVTAHVQSCTTLANFPDSHFDVVFASNLFEHLTREQLDATLSEVWRVLGRDGRLIVIQPNFKYAIREYFDDYTHVQIFTHVSLQDLLQARGFSIDLVMPRFLPFSLKAKAPKWPWLLRAYLSSPWRPFAGQMYVIARKRESR